MKASEFMQQEDKVTALLVSGNYREVAMLFTDRGNYELLYDMLDDPIAKRHFEGVFEAIGRDDELKLRIISTLVTELDPIGTFLGKFTRETLRRLGDAAIPALEKELDSEDMEHRIQALQILFELRPITSGDLALLKKMLTDRHYGPETAGVLAVTKAENHTQESAELLLQLMLQGKTQITVEETVKTMKRFGLIDRLLRNSVITDPLSSEGIAFGYGASGIISIGREEVCPLLLGYLQEENAELRIAALNAIRKLDLETHVAEILSAIIPAIADEDARVRRSAFRALLHYNSGLPKAVRDVIPAHTPEKMEEAMDDFLKELAFLMHLVGLGKYKNAIITMWLKCLGNETQVAHAADALGSIEKTVEKRRLVRTIMGKIDDSRYLVGVGMAISRMGEEAVSELLEALETKPERTQIVVIGSLVKGWTYCLGSGKGMERIQSAGLRTIAKVCRKHIKFCDDRTRELELMKVSNLYRFVLEDLNRKKTRVKMGGEILDGIPKLPRHGMYRAEARRTFA